MSEEKQITIDLSQLNESFMLGVAAKIERLLNVLLTGSYFPINSRGTSKQVDRFLKALAAEKKFVTSFNQYGLNNPRTYKSRYQLETAIKSFEKDTGLKWPFK